MKKYKFICNNCGNVIAVEQDVFMRMRKLIDLLEDFLSDNVDGVEKDLSISLILTISARCCHRRDYHLLCGGNEKG